MAMARMSGRIAFTIATALPSRMSSIPETVAVAESALPPLVLKPQEERRLHAGHLWIFSNEINVAATPLTAFEPGAHVQVRSSGDRFLGYAYVNPRTLISARLLGRDQDYPPGKSLIVHRLKVALALRKRLYPSPFYRLVFGEADLLPGLVVDRYGDVLVAQAGTAGMEAMKAEIQEALVKVIAPKALLWKNDSPVRELEGLPRYVEPAFGEVPDFVEVPEGGVNFRVPLAAGQKTGWYFDQTANRAMLARHVRDARVLDVFSYAGGFGLQAKRAGASEVTCIDSSEAALATAAATADANGLVGRAARGRCIRVARSACRRAPPVRRRRRRSAGLHQAQEGPSEGTCGLSPHQPARDAADRPRRAPDVLFLFLSPAAWRTLRRGPARRAPPRPVRPAHRRGRAVARPSRAPGDRRDAIPAGVPVPGDRLMLVYPEIDPVAFAIGPVKVHWYGLMYVVGFVVGWWLARRRAAEPGSTWKPVDVDDVIFFAAVGVIVGGRLGWILVYGFEALREDPLAIIRVWEGGMSFHGGLAGVMAAVALFALRRGRSVADVFDFMVPLPAVGLFAGRIGNFINGELWGKPTDLPWGMRVGDEVLHPSQLYEAALEGIVLFVILWWFTSSRGRASRLRDSS